MDLRPDPGGIFESDQHRRVLSHLPLPDDDPIELTALGFRVSEDPHHGLTSMDDLASVLDDLSDEGYASDTQKGLRMLKKGLEALDADVPEAAAPDQMPGPVLLEGLHVNGKGGIQG